MCMTTISSIAWVGSLFKAKASYAFYNGTRSLCEEIVSKYNFSELASYPPGKFLMIASKDGSEVVSSMYLHQLRDRCDHLSELQTEFYFSTALAVAATVALGCVIVSKCQSLQKLRQNN